ncbi:hypothetical protein F5Y00DRAFT_257073 [Daldinia vernicosa]|uniref:uncharacterized protein n=1 Tax=Daldinia vernicosa TaxID=114800 RepID=UPI002007CF52|nr:uncharacterized protein F5Y00DRAFT_257073 [Daldinia vernicosa]KAI0853772.1 hypothetical protein F5Y00DRAFT_257073 [Daldinia vernicosa]
MCKPKHKPSPLGSNPSNEGKVSDPPILAPDLASFSDKASSLHFFGDASGDEDDFFGVPKTSSPPLFGPEDYPDLGKPNTIEDFEVGAGPSGKSEQFVPGCSASKPTPTGDEDKQTISNAMMQAYIAMRGPDMGGLTDPLFEWIKFHSDEMDRKAASQPHGEPKPPDNPRDVTKMLNYMDKAIESDNMDGDSPRDAIFELRKPSINHIAPPASMNLLPHRRVCSATENRIPVWGDDEDDDEGALPTGRVSPCTFLQWAQDCKPWARGNIMDPRNTLATAERMRPMGPVPDRDHYPYYLEDAKAQRDHYTGEEFSPLYQVPHSPSLIYTPPGVPSIAWAPAAFLAQYDRMAPLEAKKLRDHVYGKTEKSMPPASTNYKFTESEVNNVANRITRSEGSGIPHGPEIYAFLSAQYKAIAKEQAEDETLRKRISAQAKRIQELELERDILREHFIPLLKKKRTEYRVAQECHALRELQKKRAIRDDRIREHLGNHVREVQLLLDRSYMQRTESKQKFKVNQQRLAQLKQEIDEDCLLAETSPRGIYDEINGLISPHLASARSGTRGMNRSAENFRAENFFPVLDDNNTYPTNVIAKQPEIPTKKEPKMGEVDSISGHTLVDLMRDCSWEPLSPDVRRAIRDHLSRRVPAPSSPDLAIPFGEPGSLAEYTGGPYRESFCGLDEQPMTLGVLRMPDPPVDTTTHDTVPGKTEESSSAQESRKEKDESLSHIQGPDERICFAPPPGEPEPIDRSYYD